MKKKLFLFLMIVALFGCWHQDIIPDIFSPISFGGITFLVGGNNCGKSTKVSTCLQTILPQGLFTLSVLKGYFDSSNKNHLGLMGKNYLTPGMIIF